MRPSLALVGLVALLTPAVLAQDTALPDGQEQSPTSSPSSAAATSTSATSATTSATTSAETSATTAATTTTGNSPTTAQNNAFSLEGLPTLAGIGVPDQKVPNTASAPFMQKSSLPDGTVFICVGAILGFLGVCVLVWRGLVAWSLHRSVKRAAMAQSVADIKGMSAIPGKRRSMYKAVAPNSSVSLDYLSAAPPGTSRPAKSPGATTVRSTSSLFFSPTAGGTAGLHAQGNRSSNYLPAGYYAAGNAAPSPTIHVGGGHHPTNSLAIPGTRPGSSPPASPALPPSRGYERAQYSRESVSMYNRNSVANVPNSRNTVYVMEDTSQSSLNVPGGTTTGGRAPSAYLEDLFESHGGNGARERF